MKSKHVHLLVPVPLYNRLVAVLRRRGHARITAGFVEAINTYLEKFEKRE